MKGMNHGGDYKPPEVPAEPVRILREAFSRVLRDPEFLADAERLEAARQYVQRDPLVVGSLLSPDRKVGIIRARIAPAAMIFIPCKDGISHNPREYSTPEACARGVDILASVVLRLAQEFGPALRGRSADGVTHAAAWVNLLSIYALTNYPPHGTFSASKAAAHSLAQCLRAEMRTAGVRVVNVFPGPIDDEWNQLLPPPKLAPEAVAKAIVGALKDGIEDVYPGDVAQEWKTRLNESAKGFERELALGSGT